MNCKPGDLAVIVRTHPETAKCLGRIVKVTTSHSISGEPSWDYEHMPLKGRRPSALGYWTWHELPDAWLLPIRDPGDDAVDETLLWKGVPILEDA